MPAGKGLKPCKENNLINVPMDDFNNVYSLVWGIELDGDPTARLESLKKNLIELLEFAEGYDFAVWSIVAREVFVNFYL